MPTMKAYEIYKDNINTTVAHAQQHYCQISKLTLWKKQVSTTKGTGGDIIILEEAAYVASGLDTCLVNMMILSGWLKLLNVVGF